MRRSSIALLLALPLLVVAVRGLAADGDLDPTFGIQGKIVMSAGGAEAIAVQGDGKILVAGWSAGDLALSRFNGDGSADTSFGTGGTVVTSILGDARATRIFVQPDGKIVVVGWIDFYPILFDTDMLLARYDSTGALDTTFGVGGFVGVTTPAKSQALDAALQPDGKIVAVGSSYGSDGDVLVMRFDTSGSPDATFGTAGQVVTDLSFSDAALAVAIQSDGSIVVGGESGGSAILLRYDSAGALDATFGTAGVVTVATSVRTLGIVLQSAGRIVALTGRSAGPTLFRFDSSGALDGSFGTAGSALAPLDGYYRYAQLAAQPDGRLLVAWAIGKSQAVVRFDANGQFDPTLSSCGAALTAFEGDNFTETRGLAVQPDGRFLITSYLTRNANSPDIETHPAIARFGTPGTATCTPAATHESRLALKSIYVVKWKWTGPATVADFGTPDLGTDHTLCLVEPSTGKPIAALTLPGTTTFCDHGTCWRAKSNGFVGTRSGLVLGKMRAKLLAGTTGTGKLVVTNKGSSPHLGSVFYPYALPVTARVKRGDGGTCWEATYSVAVKNSSDMGFVAFAD